jgi:glycine betaine/choline ABC-type transport system substrate-binding protein
VIRTRAVAAALAAGALALGAAVGGCGGSGGGARTAPSDTASSPEITVTTPLPGTGRPQIQLGDKNTPEQFLLGELYDQALQAAGFSVTLTRNIGPSSVYVPALTQGSLDMYPEYLNVLTGQIAHDQAPFRTLAAALGAGRSYAATHSIVLLAPTPFSDTEGIAVTTAYARAHRLRTIQDLRRVATGLRLGAPIEFSQSPAGLPALEQAYGFQPASTAPIDIGAQYTSLRAGTVQAAYVTTTDGELSTPEFTLLADPRHVLGFGNIVPVVTATLLGSEGPAFASIVNRVSALLTTSVIRGLNAQLEVPGQSPTGLAREFLITHGMVPGLQAGSGPG